MAIISGLSSFELLIKTFFMVHEKMLIRIFLFIKIGLTLVLRETNLSSEHNFWHGRRVKFNKKSIQ
jgi:hypothetical protein